MRKKLIILMAIALCFIPGLALADGGEVTSSELLDKAGEYDGQEITYTGEVIGDVFTRGDYAWINVFDGSNAIGVWAASGDIQSIDTIGSYTAHGETVRVKGIFNRACAEHGGDMDIHALSIEVIQEGYVVSHDVPVWKLIAGVILLAGATACVILILRKRQGPNVRISS